MLPDRIIEQDTLVVSADRVSISVRIPWYRALPLSSITGVEFSIDHVAVPRETITWTVNGHTFKLDELPPRFEEFWYVLDSAVVEGQLPALPTRDIHDVAITVGLYIPYLPAGPGFIAINERDAKSMAISEKAAA